MKYKQLGRTGLYVSELCLGTMTLGGNADAGMWAAIGAVGQHDANRLIERALAGGINFIDTADVYSFGQSERIVGQALKDLGVPRADVVLATKTAGAMGPKPNDQGASRAHIMDSVQRSLERLQVDHIDLYQIHANDPVTPIDETLRALDDLTRQGLVRYVGVSNWRAGKIGKALGLSEALRATRFETLQAYYSIAGRDVERELVPLARDEQLSLLVWSPLAGGLLSGKFGPGAPTDAGARRAHFDFPPVDLERARRVGGADRARVAPREAACDERHRRRQTDRAARRQSRRARRRAERGRAGASRHGECAAVRLSGLDDRASGGGAVSAAVRAGRRGVMPAPPSAPRPPPPCSAAGEWPVSVTARPTRR